MSYWSVLGLAVQSSRWEQSMNIKLLQMAQAAEQSVALRASAVENKELATGKEEAAVADQAEAAELEEEAAVLWGKFEADAAVAVAEQVDIEELEAEIVGEEEQSAAHAAAATLDEATFDGEMAEGMADAAEASRIEAQAHGEEVFMGICEFVPLADVVCDFVGGITAVGLELNAAAEVAKASGEWAAAAAAKADEEREISLAGELQAKAVEDGALAAELQGEEAAEEELAEEERLAGEEKEAASEAMLEQAEVEEEAAAEETALAAEQEEEADSLAGKAIVHGMLSCWDAIMASVVGILSLTFFTVRVAAKGVLPAAAQSFIFVSAISQGSRDVFSHSVWRNISYVVHHCALFLLLAGIFASLLDGLEQNSLKARGGIILCFGFTGSCLQTVLLHVVPNFLAKSQGFCQMVAHIARISIVLTVLFVLEILIVWVNLGPEVFKQGWLHELSRWWLWVLFLVPLGYHLLHLEIPRLKSGDCISESDSSASVEKDLEKSGGKDSLTAPTESDCLLPSDKRSLSEDGAATRTKRASTKSWFSLLHQEMMRLQIPFEILILSCMLGLVLHCISSTSVLWPASKALLLATLPEWLLPVGVVLAVIGIAFVAVSVIYR
jgi:hypothetical protein